MDTNATENGLLKSLSGFLKSEYDPETSIPQIAELLGHASCKVRAKALWILGEIGYKFSDVVAPYVFEIASFLQDDNDMLRERAVGALGRIGRASYRLIEPYLDEMLKRAHDPIPAVRMNTIWAAENIAINHPEVFTTVMDLFAALLNDDAVRVRIEAPEIFRVMGKRKPDAVAPYMDKLQRLAENDTESVVRIHAQGAIRATQNGMQQQSTQNRKDNLDDSK